MEVLSAEQLESIHATSLRILEDLGMEVMSLRVLSIFKAGHGGENGSSGPLPR